MEQVYQQVYLLWCGLKDSLTITPIRRYVLTPHKNSREIRKILGESLVHLFVYFIVVNVCVWGVSRWWENAWVHDMVSQSEWGEWSEWVVKVSYQVFFMVPLYIITTIYTFFWFGDIANLAFEIERDYYRVKIVQAKQSIETVGANALKKIVFMLVYLVLSLLTGSLLALIPFVGKTLVIVLYSLYYALFLFLLKWNYNPYILAYFEQNAAYFVGFGLLYSWFTNLFTGPLNDGVYWILFPIYIFNATCTQPPHLKNTPIKSLKQLRDMMRSLNYTRDNTSYDEHLKLLRDDSLYKKQCLNQGTLFKLVRKLTNHLNKLIGNYLITPSSPTEQ